MEQTEKETDEKSVEQKETPKNKWLYADDNFGKLEKDIVFESKTYQSRITKTEIESFKIIAAKQTKRLKKKK